MWFLKYKLEIVFIVIFIGSYLFCSIYNSIALGNADYTYSRIPDNITEEEKKKHIDSKKNTNSIYIIVNYVYTALTTLIILGTLFYCGKNKIKVNDLHYILRIAIGAITFGYFGYSLFFSFTVRSLYTDIFGNNTNNIRDKIEVSKNEVSKNDANTKLIIAAIGYGVFGGSIIIVFLALFGIFSR
jgi:hypothetical protein